MDQIYNLEFSKFFCSCQKVYLLKSEISSHLKLPYCHKISSVNRPLQSSNNIIQSIHSKIEAIIKIQSSIQQSSINLIKAITLNTELALNKLTQLEEYFKTTLSNKPRDKNFLNKDILSNLTISNSLKVSLIEHFDKNPVFEKSNTLVIKKKIKSKISNVFKDKSFSFECMVISSDESFMITGGYGGFIQVWDLKKNNQSYSLKKCKGDVYSLALGSGDEIMLSGSGDLSVRLWDLNSRKQVHKFIGHTQLVFSVFISNDNKTGFSGSLDETIKIWDLEMKEIEFTVSTSFGVYELRLIKEQKVLVATGMKGCIFFWNRETKKSNKTIINQNNRVRCFCLSNDECYLLTGNSDGSVKILTYSNFKIIFEDKKHNEEILKIEISPNSQYFATCSRYEKVLLWDYNKKSLVKSIDIKNCATSIKFLKNFQYLAFCSPEPKIGYFNLNTKKIDKTINPKMLFDVEIAISSDLRYFAYIDSKIHLYSLQLSSEILNISNNISICTYLKFSPCGSYLISGYIKGEVILFKVPCLTVVTKINLNKSKITCLAISSNNKFLACANSQSILDIYLIETKEIVYTEKNVIVKSAVFCYNDKRFIYTVEYLNIQILDNFFNKVGIFNFDHMAYRVLACEDDRTVIVSDTQSKWSSLNAKTAEIIFKSKSREKFIQWSKEKQDSKCQIFVDLVGINI